MRRRARKNTAGQRARGVIANLQSMIEVTRANYRQHRPEDFFLRDPARRLDLAKNYRPDKKSVSRRSHFQDALCRLLAQANILGNPRFGFPIDHRSKVIARILGRTDLETARRTDEPSEQTFVNFV